MPQCENLGIRQFVVCTAAQKGGMGQCVESLNGMGSCHGCI